jgi:hypothetical protein
LGDSTTHEGSVVHALRCLSGVPGSEFREGWKLP